MTKKGPGGRPFLPPGVGKTKVVRVSVSPAEHAAIMELSRRTGRKAGAIARDYMLAQAKRAGIEIKDPTEK